MRLAGEAAEPLIWSLRMTTLCLAEFDNATLDMLGQPPDDAKGRASLVWPIRSSGPGSSAPCTTSTSGAHAVSVVRLPPAQACAMPRDWRASIVTGRSS